MRFDIRSRRANELLLVLHASRQPRDIQTWRSLASLKLARRDARPREFAAQKAGAT